MENLEGLLQTIKKLHSYLRDQMVLYAETHAEELRQPRPKDSAEDTLYALDLVAEKIIRSFFDRSVLSNEPLLLLAEGLPEGELVHPPDSDPDRLRWRILMDPVDGTRNLMYQKRSGWILTGVARNRGPQTNLQDIVCSGSNGNPTG